MSYESTILARSPVLYLPFTETSGTTFADLTGNGHTGTAITEAVVGGDNGPVNGEKAVLTGPDKLLTVIGIANASSLTVGGTNFTYEAWAKINVITNTGGHDKGINFRLINSDGSRSFYFRLSYTNAMWVLTEDLPNDWFSSTCGFFPTHPTTVISSNPGGNTTCWHHYVVTWDSSSIIMYLDGISQTFQANNQSCDPTWSFGFTPANMYVQTSLDSTTEFSPTMVSINHLAVYNYALTSSQVLENYHASWPRQDGDCYGGVFPNAPHSGQFAILARVYRNRIDTNLKRLRN